MLAYASLTKTGSRQINEDSVGARRTTNGMFCIVADGLGGHSAGEVASKLAVEAALRVIEKGGHAFEETLAACMNEGQNSIMEEQLRQKRVSEMKTTAAMLLIEGNMARWAHIGDSRVYMFEGADMASRTIDHSVPQMLAIQGEIEEKEIRFHEDRNRLTRVMGVEWDTPRFVLSDTVKLAAPVSFLLCSDGFWEYIDEKEMSRLLKNTEQPGEWLIEMEKIVLENGKNKNMDNYSAVAAFLRS